MNSCELVKAAIAHRDTPRTPYCIGFTKDGAQQLIDMGIADVEKWVDNDVARIGPPWWGWKDLARDWSGPDAPVSRATVMGYGSYEAFRDQAKAARDAGKYVLAMVYGSHWEKAYFSRGIENFLADIAGEYDFAKKLCRTIIEKNLVMLENFLLMPEIDGVLLGSDWGTQRSLIMSPEVWDDLIRPGEQEEYDLIHAYGKHVWIHSCGAIEPLIPRLIDMGADVLNPVQPECMDIEMLKRTWGDRITWWGGISTQKTLPYGTPDAVRAEARATRALLGKSGGYVYGPSQEIQGDVPGANIVALVETAKECACAM